MATKKIILQFRDQPIVGTAFTYDIYINGVKMSYLNTLNAVNINYKAGGNNTPLEIGLGADMNETIDNTLSFLNSVYQANSAAGGYLTSLSYARVGNSIEVSVNSTAPENKITFFRISSNDDNLRIIAENPCEFAFITNQTIGQENIDAIEALIPNFYMIKNNTLNTWVFQVIPNTIETRLSRGYNYSVYNGAYQVVATFEIPIGVSEANTVLFFNNNDLFININGSDPSLTFLYSLDDITYQSESIFEDLAEGEHTVYVLDSLGCKKTFTVTNTGTTNGNDVTPYTDISESNSLRFVRRVERQNCGNYRNQFNTLSCEENVQIPNQFTQLFQSCDIIKTQVKTSYQNVEVGAGNTEITANKIVANIGLRDKRDCTYYSFNNQLAVLFTSGNTYDYNTSDISGTYELNGLLPPYGVIGTWVETDYGVLQIADIRLADNGQRSLIFNLAVSIPYPVAGTIQTIYNRESYDIWEFAIDMSLFLNTSFNVGVRFYQTEVDPNFPDIYWKSERIQVKERWSRSTEIIYRNSKNTDIYFFSGIEMKLRLNFCDVNTNLSDGEVEIQKTDSSVISIDATNYNAIEFEANFLTTGMIRKLKLALKHDFLVIENVPYKLAETPETERRGKSNFYNLKAKLLEAGDVWNQGTANTQTIISNVPLIGLLEGDSEAEYLRIQ